MPHPPPLLKCAFHSKEGCIPTSLFVSPLYAVAPTMFLPFPPPNMNHRLLPRPYHHKSHCKEHPYRPSWEFFGDTHSGVELLNIWRNLCPAPQQSMKASIYQWIAICNRGLILDFLFTWRGNTWHFPADSSLCHQCIQAWNHKSGSSSLPRLQAQLLCLELARHLLLFIRTISWTLTYYVNVSV